MFDFIKILWWIGQFAGKRQDIIMAIITLNITYEYTIYIYRRWKWNNSILSSKSDAYKNAQKARTDIENENVKEKREIRKKPAVKDRELKPNDKD